MINDNFDKDFDKMTRDMQKGVVKVAKYAVVAWLVGAALSFTLVGVVIYLLVRVATHFS